MVPQRKIKGQYVSAVFSIGYNWRIVCNGIFPGAIVGPRLDRGRGSYPQCENNNLTRSQAEEAVEIWDKFMELQESKKK